MSKVLRGRITRKFKDSEKGCCFDAETQNRQKGKICQQGHQEIWDELDIGIQVKFQAENPNDEKDILVEDDSVSIIPETPQQTIPIPYRFAAIEIDKAVTDRPVWHDGSSGGGLLSGEIQCEMVALTPLLAANDQYKSEDAKSAAKRDAMKNEPNVQLRQGWLNSGKCVKEGKNILEPLHLDDGRLAISGATIKGMVRQSLSALLHAPMERVTEHHYTYRPNINHEACKPAYECRAAIVISKNGDEVSVKILSGARNAVFLHGDAPDSFSGYKAGDPVQKKFDNLDFGFKKRDGSWKKDNNRISHRDGNFQIDLNHLFLCYKGGIDGKGLLARKEVHHEALVLLEDLKNIKPVKVDLKVIQDFQHAQKILADQGIGHLIKAHPLSSTVDMDRVAKKIHAAAELEENQLIYVEVLSDNPTKVVSLGHHYLYRWAYRDSVRTRKREDGTRCLRDCLGTIPGEQPTIIKEDNQKKEISPDRLTGARLLFGYAAAEGCGIQKTSGVYDRLTGRVSCNMAVSVGIPEFLGERPHHCVPLKILGQPRPSAMEFYLKQPEENEAGPAMNTYGDLDESGGELAGRKFYRHQPDAATDPSCYTATDSEIETDQAALARYICKPGTQFRFTLRFARLRPWEVGALLAVLNPGKLAPENEAHKRYAHKLGHGRPLGLGSVQITRSRLLTAREDSLDSATEPANRGQAFITAFKAKLGAKNISPGPWLELHEFGVSGRAEYPTKYKNGKWHIYEYHTDIRRQYSALRREDGVSQTRIDRFRDIFRKPMQARMPAPPSPADPPVPATGNNVLLIFTAGSSDVQLVFRHKVTGDLVRRELDSKMKNPSLREFHRDLLKIRNEVVFCDHDFGEGHAKKAPQERLPKEDARYPESWLGFHVEGYDARDENGKLQLYPAKLCNLPKDLEKDGLTLKAVLGLATNRPGKPDEPIANEELLRHWLRSKYALGDAAKVAPYATENYEGHKIPDSFVDAIDKAIKEFANDTKGANGESDEDAGGAKKIWLSLMGGIPGAREVAANAARLHFHANDLKENIRFIDPKNKTGEDSSRQPHDPLRDRRFALAAVLRGDFVGAAAFAEIYRKVNDDGKIVWGEGDRQRPWAEPVYQAAKLFTGNPTQEWLDPTKAPSLPVLQEIANYCAGDVEGRPLRCLLRALRVDAALQAKRWLEAINESIDFLDAALNDAIDRNFGRHDLDLFDTWDVVLKKKFVDDLNRLPQMDRPRLFNKTVGADEFKSPFLTVNEVSKWINLLRNNGAYACGDSIQKLHDAINPDNKSDKSEEGTSPEQAGVEEDKSNPIKLKDIRNTNTHSALTQDQVNTAKRSFIDALLWCGKGNSLSFSETDVIKAILASFGAPTNLYEKLVQELRDRLQGKGWPSN